MVGDKTQSNKLEGISKEALAIFYDSTGTDGRSPPQDPEQVINAFKDTYLELVENASFKPGEIADMRKIKENFRKLSKIYHGDVNHDPAAAEIYGRINSAYRILSDPDKKRIIDNALEAYWSRSTNPHASAVDAMGEEPVGQPKAQQQVVYTPEEIKVAEKYISQRLAAKVPTTQIGEELIERNWNPNIVKQLLKKAQPAKDTSNQSLDSLVANSSDNTANQVPIDLQNYVSSEIANGTPLDKIRQACVKQTWELGVVNLAIQNYQTNNKTPEGDDKTDKDYKAPEQPPADPKPGASRKRVPRILKSKPKEPEQKPKAENEGSLDDLLNAKTDDKTPAADNSVLVFNKDYGIAYGRLFVRDINSTDQYDLPQVLAKLHTAKFDKEAEKKARALLKKYHSALNAYEKELQCKIADKETPISQKSELLNQLKALQQGKQAFEKGEKVSKEEPVRNIDRYSKAQYAGHVAAGGLTAAGLYLADKFNVAGEILTYFNVNMSDHQYINAVLNTLDNTVSNLSIPTPFGIIPGLPDVPILPEILIGLGIGAAVAYGNVKKQARIVADTAKRAWHKMFKESIEPPQESDSPPKRSFWSFGRKRYAGPVPPPMTPPPALFDDEDNNYDNDTGNQSNLEDKLPPQGPPANDSGFVDVPEDDVAWSDQAPPQPQQPQNYTTYTLKFKDPKTQKTEYLQPFKYTLNAAGVPVYANGQPVPPKIPFRTPDGRKLSIKVDSQPLIKKYNKEFKQQ